MEHARDGGGLPTTGFPRVIDMETSDNSDTVQTVHLIHARASHHGRLGLYLRSVRFQSGSGSAKEVVVHGRSGGRHSRGDVEEVVVHGDGSSGSCRSRTL